MRVLITGGAGFVGAHLAITIREKHPRSRIVCLDNLSRKGSRLKVPLLRRSGIAFQRGDVRIAADMNMRARFDLVIDAAAEPSVLAGTRGSEALGVVDINLIGTLRALEIARRAKAAFLFLSTSRVHPIRALRSINLLKNGDRFTIAARQTIRGVTRNGISEDFPMDGHRSVYGASKLAAEHFVEEYAALHDIPAIIDRCGLIAGPGQMGKTDQGVVTYWISSHIYERPLTYIGFGGSGRQVRDVLHIDDLSDLVLRQLNAIERYHGAVFHVGGGPRNAVSLRDLTRLCRELSGVKVPVGRKRIERPCDIPLYITDSRRAAKEFRWKPRRGVPDTIADTATWIRSHKAQLASVLT